MDKSEMEDAGKESHEALDNLIESKDSLVDKNVEPEPDEQKDPSLSNTDPQNSIDKIETDAKTVLEKGELSNTEIETQEQNNAKTEILEVSNTEGMKDDKTDAKTGPEDQNKLNTESEDQNKLNTESEDQNKLNTESEDQNKTNTESEDQNKTNIQSEDQNKTNTELEDQNKTNTELEDQNKTNTESEDQNKTNTELEDQNKTNTLLEGQNKTNIQLEGQNKTNIQLEDQNMTSTQSEDQNMTNTQSEDQNKINTQSNDQNTINTQLEDENMTNTQSEDENMTNTQSEVRNKTNTQSQDQNNTSIKSEIKELADLRDLEKEQNPSENGKNFENSLQSKTEDQKASQNVEGEQLQLQASAISLEKKEVVDEGQQTENQGLVKGIVDQVLNKDTVDATKELKEPEIKPSPPASALSNENVNVGEKTSKVIKYEPKDISVGNKRQSTTPDLPMKYSTRSAGHSGEASRNVIDEAKMPESEDGTPEEQAAFMKELENFYRERAVEFKPPKFYGQPLNCLKLWRAVIKLGGYDRVTGSKMWRQVGESFHPPKTCTTVSWTFRIFYEKSLLEYERYQRQNGDLQLPAAVLPEPSSVDNEGNGYQAPGSGRARRDAAARAMQGWHVQRLFGYNEDKNLNNMPKRENKLKSIGSLKQKRPNEIELPVKAQRTETSKQLVTNVVDVGAPADWVKINVRETKDSFEVYALVPGLLREEVRVQSDPAGRLVITGQPEQPDNPWGITPFKKVVSLPARIDPLQTSAVVSLHGRLFVRVPFEQSNT